MTTVECEAESCTHNDNGLCRRKKLLMRETSEYSWNEDCQVICGDFEKSISEPAQEIM